MWKYYGLDWANVFLVPLHIWLLGSRKRVGFLVGIVSCLFSLSWSYMAESYANIVLAMLLMALHVRGYVLWGRRIQMPLVRRIYPEMTKEIDDRDREVPTDRQ